MDSAVENKVQYGDQLQMVSFIAPLSLPCRNWIEIMGSNPSIHYNNYSEQRNCAERNSVERNSVEWNSIERNPAELSSVDLEFYARKEAAWFQLLTYSGALYM